MELSPTDKASAGMASAWRNPGRTVRSSRRPSGSMITVRLNAEVSFSIMWCVAAGPKVHPDTGGQPVTVLALGVHALGVLIPGVRDTE